MEDKHDKPTDEGRALCALRETRVQARPSWSALQVSVKHVLIQHEEEVTFEGRDRNPFLNDWNRLLVPSERLKSVQAQGLALTRISAAD